MELILISAMTRERVIGRAGGLPWSIPEEYAMFLAHVRGRPVVMGRTSYEIFGGDLTESPVMVISRSVSSLAGVEVCPDVDSALRAAAARGERVFCAGGATVYRQTLPRADAMYLSIIKRNYEGDATFPAFDDDSWKVASREDHAEFEFRIYLRRRPRAR